MKVFVQPYQHGSFIPFYNACVAEGGGFYRVVVDQDGRTVTHKFSIANIFRVIEEPDDTP